MSQKDWLAILDFTSNAPFLNFIITISFFLHFLLQIFKNFFLLLHYLLEICQFLKIVFIQKIFTLHFHFLKLDFLLLILLVEDALIKDFDSEKASLKLTSSVEHVTSWLFRDDFEGPVKDPI